MNPELSFDEMMFFDRKPQIMPLYEALRAALMTNLPDAVIKVDKTQISFKNRYIFACASMQRVPKAPKDYLLVTFGLDHKKASPRIAVATEASPNRWTHHVVVTQEDDIDDELLSWIDEAYQFSAQKGRWPR